MLQDEPVTTQVNMPAPFIAQVCAEIAQIQAVKLEEPPTLPKITRLRALFGDRVAIFGGLGGVYFFEELSRGADGAMTGFPYPEALRAIRDHFVAGRRDEARALFYRWLPLIRYETQPGATPGTAVGIRKEILRRRGWIACALVRPPAPVARRGHADRARRAARRRPSPERRAPRPGQRRPPLLPGDRRARRARRSCSSWAGAATTPRGRCRRPPSRPSIA